MSQALAQFNPAGVPAHITQLFGGVSHQDLTAGAEAAFPMLSLKGKVWRVAHGGEQRVLQRDGEPLPSIDVVLVTANRNLSKLYYAKAYAEGDDDAPDCSSANGVTPDAGVPAPQSATCATCQHNVWGSKITEQGKKTKACSDMRRVALIPERDMECKPWGAPLLLRVPPGSFQNLTEYARTALGGKEYCAVVTRIGFDMMAAYPKLTFKPLRWVTEAEAEIIARWREHDIVKRIIGTDADPSAPNVRVTAPPSTLRPAVVVQAQPPGAADLTRAILAAGGAIMTPPVVATTLASDPFTQAPVAPAPAPAPAVVQAPVDPLAGLAPELRAAVMAAGGPDSPSGKHIMQVLAARAAALAKWTRRTRAQLEAANAAAAEPSVPPLVSSVVATLQGELVGRAAAPLPAQPAPVTTAAPTGQEDLLAGVDALLAGLDNMPFDD
jgi:hypothetical protein